MKQYLANPVVKHILMCTQHYRIIKFPVLQCPGDFPGSLDCEESSCNAGNLGLSAGLGRCLGEGNGYPLQYSCLENSMNRGDWQDPVHGVTKSWMRLSD